jgi:hypothetical protein
MMQELAAGLRQGGLNIFRHRRGMLFVSPIRTRVFGHEGAAVSATINAILQKLTGASGMNRKQLAEQLAPATEDTVEQERAKRTLASDLRWLISEGYVIEFNDGTLDLPRAKAPQPSQPQYQAPPAAEAASQRTAELTTAREPTPAATSPGADEPAGLPATPFDAEGVPPADEAIESGEQMEMSVEQSIEPADEQSSSGSEPSPASTEQGDDKPAPAPETGHAQGQPATAPGDPSQPAEPAIPSPS